MLVPVNRSTATLAREAKKAFDQAEFSLVVPNVLKASQTSVGFNSNEMTAEQRIGLGLLRVNDALEFHYFNRWRKAMKAYKAASTRLVSSICPPLSNLELKPSSIPRVNQKALQEVTDISPRCMPGRSNQVVFAKQTPASQELRSLESGSNQKELSPG